MQGNGGPSDSDLRRAQVLLVSFHNLVLSIKHRSSSQEDNLGQAFKSKVALQALQVEGQPTVPVAIRSCFASMMPLLKEKPATV